MRVPLVNYNKTERLRYLQITGYDSSHHIQYHIVKSSQFTLIKMFRATMYSFICLTCFTIHRNFVDSFIILFKRKKNNSLFSVFYP